MKVVDVKRTMSVLHAYHGRGIVVADPERTPLGRLSGAVSVLFDRDLPRYGNQPRIVQADRLTAIDRTTGIPLATAEALDCGGNVSLMRPPSPDARFGGRKIGGVEVIQGGRG